MTCPKCSGTMYSGYFMEDAFYATPIPCLRCVNCGELLDDTILKNRTAPHQIEKSARKRVFLRRHFQ